MKNSKLDIALGIIVGVFVGLLVFGFFEK